MRYGLLVTGLILLPLFCVGVYQGGLGGVYDRLTRAALSEDARTAVDIRCRIEDDGAARQCRATLEKLYLAGSLDPDKTLRAWCDAVKEQRWGGARPKPPELCVRRYGGWKAG
jgi:hypothetical protein